MIIVLDASALLAYLHDEPGAEKVDAIISDCLISTVNWSEVVQKLLSRGVAFEGLHEDITALGVKIEAFSEADAECAAKIWSQSSAYGLSLGDRACLAFAMRLQAPVLTADQAWLKLASPLKLDIQSIR